mmetsp:Transcript_1551/g.164  ORF Transcript_1551/g.164 Transcript_1551/m.164 type:complete len:116 (+) Transcript_1551:1446-1793(+)
MKIIVKVKNMTPSSIKITHVRLLNIYPFVASKYSHFILEGSSTFPLTFIILLSIFVTGGLFAHIPLAFLKVFKQLILDNFSLNTMYAPITANEVIPYICLSFLSSKDFYAILNLF